MDKYSPVIRIHDSTNSAYDVNYFMCSRIVSILVFPMWMFRMCSFFAHKTTGSGCGASPRAHLCVQEVVTSICRRKLKGDVIFQQVSEKVPCENEKKLLFFRGFWEQTQFHHSQTAIFHILYRRDGRKQYRGLCCLLNSKSVYMTVVLKFKRVGWVGNVCHTLH